MATQKKQTEPPTPGDSYVQSFARGLQVIRSFSAGAPVRGASCSRCRRWAMSNPTAGSSR
jgi:hypothetical protein